MFYFLRPSNRAAVFEYDGCPFQFVSKVVNEKSKKITIRSVVDFACVVVVDHHDFLAVESVSFLRLFLIHHKRLLLQHHISQKDMLSQKKMQHMKQTRRMRQRQLDLADTTSQWTKGRLQT